MPIITVFLWFAMVHGNLREYYEEYGLFQKTGLARETQSFRIMNLEIGPEYGESNAKMSYYSGFPSIYKMVTGPWGTLLKY